MKTKFKKGQRVLIMRRAESHARGWDNNWVGEMDEFIGKIARVVSDDGADGVLLACPGCEYWFPHFVLRRATSRTKEFAPPKPVEFRLNDQYTARITRDEVIVGCQSFTHEKIAALAKACARVRGRKK